jgi:hypothetical protein
MHQPLPSISQHSVENPEYEWYNPLAAGSISRPGERGSSMMRVLLVCLIGLLVTTSSMARTWHIKPDGTGDAPTIQAGIDAAADDDTLALADGIYTGSGNRWITQQGRRIVIQSQSDDPTLCIIDCEGNPTESHRGFVFTGHGTDGSVLRGVTVRSGYLDPYSWPRGAAVLCDSASPELVNCTFLGNYADLGGAVLCIFSSASISNCRFWDNSARLSGGALYVREGAPLIENCEFTGNTAGRSGGAIVYYNSDSGITGCVFNSNAAATDGGSADWGGGAISLSGASPTIASCTFHGNRDEQGLAGAVLCLRQSSPTILSSVLANSTKGVAVQCLESSPVLLCCDVYGNTDGNWVGCIEYQYGIYGNFSACPSFCAAAMGDLHLCDESPCLPGNHPDGYDCNLIGALGQGCSCGPTQTEGTSWGAIKSMY